MKTVCLSLALVLVFASCKPKEIHDQQQRGSALLTVLAEETAQLAGAKKQIVLIAAESAKPSKEEEEFKAALKKKGLSVVTTKSVKLGDPMSFDAFGLTPADFVEVVEKNPEVGAVVSLVGAPLLKPGGVANVPSSHPPVLVVATALLGKAPGVPSDRGHLAVMLNTKIIQLAIVEGADPNLKTGKTDTAHKIFDQYYRILR